MSNWYANENEGWYAPLLPEEPAQKRTKWKLGGWAKAAIAVLLVVALIASSALIFPNKSKSPAIVKPSQQQDSNDGSFGQFVIPRTDDDTMPDDFRDFFNSYYTETEDSGRTTINIERVKLPLSFSLSTSDAGEELTLQELYRRCSESIVAITGYVDGKSGYSWATGIILSEDGLVLTNTHVIADCDRATVTLGDDSVYEAKLVGADAISDIAVLKIEASGLTSAVFGDSSALVIGDRVAAIGNPLGEEYRLTLTQGIISGIERGINYKGHNMSLLQTDTAINEGNSGGPLLNMSGQVVGITNMKMMSSYSSIEGIGFAIPSTTVVKIVNLLVKEGSVTGRPAIGITVGMIPDSARERYGALMPEEGGLYVVSVSEGSDALAKGIRPGDIITEVNGTIVTTMDELKDIKDKLAVGDSLHLVILRNGEKLELDILLVETNDVYG